MGTTLGSKDNSDYYRTVSFLIINLGITVSGDIVISDSFKLLVFTSVAPNPNKGNMILFLEMSF